MVALKRNKDYVNNHESKFNFLIKEIDNYLCHW